MDIDPGIVEDDVPARPGGQLRQDAGQPIEIRRVAGAVRQGDVEVGGDLAHRIVALAMHREGEGARLVPQNVRRAVALMHVEIDDQDVAGGALGKQHQRGDRHVVEGAEAGALRASRMMAAAGGVAGNAVS